MIRACTGATAWVCLMPLGRSALALAMTTSLADTLTSLLLGLRDGLRPSLLLHALGSLLAVLVCWFVLFSVVDERWWSLATLSAHVQSWTHLDASVATVLAALLFTFSYVLLVLTSMALVILFVLMPRIRQVCLRGYPALAQGTQAVGTGMLTLWRHAMWMVLAASGALLLGWVLPVVGALLGTAVMAHANVRGLLVDALEGLATAAELQTVLRQQRVAITLLGLALSVLAMVPVLGLLSLFIMGPSASHLAFRGLMRQRSRRG
jgi:hypothetical protein